MRYAASLHYRYVIWIDCDTEFVKTVPFDFCVREFDGHPLFYCRGHREAPEVGIFGVDLENDGKDFVKALCERYTSRDYLKYHRWDDGFQIGSLVDEGVVTASDLVHQTKYIGRTNDVIPRTKLGKYIKHDKGRHGRKTGLML